MVTVYYHSGWTQPFLHYNSGSEWRNAEMTRTERFYWHSVEMTSLPMRFVFTDGLGQWDNPSQKCTSVIGRNYQIVEPGRYVVFKGELTKIRDSTRVLLITDLDGTLLEENNAAANEASERFARYWLERHYFNDSKLVYSTGRSLEQFLALKKSKIVLLDPDVLITSVGSDAYIMRSDTGEYDVQSAYSEIFNTIHWDTSIVSQTIDAHFPWLIQPRSQMDFRLKTWRQARVEDLADHERHLVAFVRDPANFPSGEKSIRCRVHISGQGDYRYLDFTPSNGAKRAGVEYCQQRFGFSVEETLVSGDSGNDFAMLRGHENAVIPANRSSDMDSWFYKKNRGPNKYISERDYADAILEALDRLAARRSG